MFDVASGPAISPLAVTIDNAARLSGRNRRRIYEAIRAGDLLARKDGRATLILVADLDAWLHKLPRVQVG
jgi:excisionase family DNA binding protein